MNDELAAQILTNMFDNTRDDIDTREGSPTYTVAAPFADELHLLYAELKAQEEADFIVDAEGNVTMYGIKLDLFVNMWGEERKPGGKATGEVILYADEEVLVPAGTELFAPATLRIPFVTNEDVTATPAGVTVGITAVYDGADGNVSADSITGVVGDLEGVLRVTNPSPTEGGFDEESDEELATRFLNNRRRGATSGNANHYRQWATEVSGILDAYVVPVWNGPNTVRVVLLSSNYDAPTPEKVAEAKEYIDSVRPVIGNETDPVTVEAATEIPVNITVDVQSDGNFNQEDFETLVTQYLESLTAGEQDEGSQFDQSRIVRVVRLENALIDTEGVTDYSNFLVNGTEENITVPPGSVPVLGSVTVNVTA